MLNKEGVLLAELFTLEKTPPNLFPDCDKPLKLFKRDKVFPDNSGNDCISTANCLTDCDNRFNPSAVVCVLDPALANCPREETNILTSEFMEETLFIALKKSINSFCNGFSPLAVSKVFSPAFANFAKAFTKEVILEFTPSTPFKAFISFVNSAENIPKLLEFSNFTFPSFERAVAKEEIPFVSIVALENLSIASDNGVSCDATFCKLPVLMLVIFSIPFVSVVKSRDATFFIPCIAVEMFFKPTETLFKPFEFEDAFCNFDKLSAKSSSALFALVALAVICMSNSPIFVDIYCSPTFNYIKKR